VATVLIVDDEPNIRRMVGALLTAEGHDVKEASTGSQALTRAAEDDPDAV
jgi:DNA-binding response OmpR family regulator